jgi:hypothetical protein
MIIVNVIVVRSRPKHLPYRRGLLHAYHALSILCREIIKFFLIITAVH